LARYVGVGGGAGATGTGAEAAAKLFHSEVESELHKNATKKIIPWEESLYRENAWYDKNSGP
jgi:hypothetical protein